MRRLLSCLHRSVAGWTIRSPRIIDQAQAQGHAVEGPAADGLAGDDAEEDLDHVQPAAAGGGEVQVDAGVLRESGLDVGVLVGGVVVAHHVQLDPGVGLGDLLEEGQELDVGVLLKALSSL